MYGINAFGGDCDKAMDMSEYWLGNFRMVVFLLKEGWMMID